jgi:hypothetical protein
VELKTYKNLTFSDSKKLAFVLFGAESLSNPGKFIEENWL